MTMTKRSTRAAFLLAAMALIGAAAVQAQPRFNFDTTPGTLSKQVVPSRYALTLNLDPAHDDFTGQVTISVKLRQSAPFIELHAHELKASRATLATAGASRPLQVTAQEATRTCRTDARASRVRRRSMRSLRRRPCRRISSAWQWGTST